MKEQIKNFFKDGYNIALVVLQAIALIFVCTSSLSPYFVVFALVFEGAFFIVWGVKVLHGNKLYLKSLDNLTQLPYSKAELDLIKRRAEYQVKGNKTKGVLFVIAGIVIFFSIISAFI